jgi:transketolase
MPCWELFAEQDQSYRDEVLPPAVRARVAVEAAASFGWERWIGEDGEMIGVDRFGASAPGATVLEQYGFTPDNVTDRARRLLDKLGRGAGKGPLDDLPA